MSPISKISLPLILLLIDATLYAPAQVTAQTNVERIDEVVRHYHERGYLNGAVLVGKAGQIIYEKGVGEADFGSHTPNTPLTKFGIGSITKQFTALLVLQEVDKGNLSLNDAVAKVLPWYRLDTGSQITQVVRQGGQSLRLSVWHGGQGQHALRVAPRGD